MLRERFKNVSNQFQSCTDNNELLLKDVVVMDGVHLSKPLQNQHLLDPETLDNLNQLLKYIKENDLSQIKRLRSVINVVHPRYHKPPLLLASNDSHGFDKVDGTTLQEIINLGAQIDHFNSRWYGWEPIHYAAAATNPEKLTVLLDHLPKDKINTLTTLSENALHVLLDYSKYCKSFEVPYQNGTTLNMSTIVSPEYYGIVQCARLIIASGIDVNHSNFYNETPILLAIRRKYLGVVKELLEVEGIDLDSCRDPTSGKTARELLKGQELIFGLLPRPIKISDAKTLLFHYLKAGDQDQFLKYNGGNIQRFVNRCDGDNLDNSSCTLLQYCFRKAFISYFNCLKEHHGELDATKNIYNNPVVQRFCKSGMIKCIDHLLNNHADINLTLRKFATTVLEEAVLSGFYPFVCLLLAHKKTQITCQQICNLLPKLVSDDHHVDNNIFKCNIEQTLLVLLNKLDQLQDQYEINPDKLNDTLHIAVDMLHAQSICMLLDLGASLVHNQNNKIIMERIYPNTLEKHLDDCIEDEGSQVKIHLDSMIDHNGGITAINFLLNSETCNKYLNHLVIKTLIHTYWENLRIFFTVNLIFYICLYCLLNVHILLQFNNVYYYVLDAAGISLLIWFALREIVQFALNYKNYIFEINNILEISFVIFTVMSYLTKARILMVLSILTSNMVLLLLLEQVPKCAKFLIIFRTAVFYLKFIIFYFIQFVAFSVCFYILFFNPEEDGIFWETIPRKVFETIMFFTGNIESDKLNFTNYPVFGRIVFLIFLFFMPLILNNLLLGLLVADMSTIQENSKLYEQTRRACFITRLTNFLSSNHRILPTFLTARAQLPSQHYVIRNKADLQEYDRHYVQSVFKKRSRRPEILNTLYSYITTNSKKHDEDTFKEINRELLEKLRMLEEKYRDLHDIKELLKLEVMRNKL